MSLAVVANFATTASRANFSFSALAENAIYITLKFKQRINLTLMNDYSDLAEGEARIVETFFAYRDTCIANRIARGEDPDAIPYSISLLKLRDDISAVRFAYDAARKEDIQRRYEARKTLVLELASHDLTEEQIHFICRYDPREIHQMIMESNKSTSP